MTWVRSFARISAAIALASALAATAFANLPDESIGGPLSGPPVFGAPFSADATTTVHAILGDGTRIDHSTTDRYYRDSAGRVRVERMIDQPAPSTVSERWIRTIVDPTPGDRMVYGIDAQTRSRQASPRSITGTTTGGGRSFHVYIGGWQFVGFQRAADLLSADPGAVGDVREELLGTQRIAGVEATGRRLAIVVPPRYRGNSSSHEITDERWESPELKLLVLFRHSSPQSTVEYRLANIQRDEPPAQLFVIPPDYTEGYSMTRKDHGMSFVLAEHFRRERAAR